LPVGEPLLPQEILGVAGKAILADDLGAGRPS